MTVPSWAGGKGLTQVPFPFPTLSRVCTTTHRHAPLPVCLASPHSANLPLWRHMALRATRDQLGIATWAGRGGRCGWIGCGKASLEWRWGRGCNIWRDRALTSKWAVPRIGRGRIRASEPLGPSLAPPQNGQDRGASAEPTATDAPRPNEQRCLCRL